jgi:hypothetical protein
METPLHAFKEMSKGTCVYGLLQQFHASCLLDGEPTSPKLGTCLVMEPASRRKKC